VTIGTQIERIAESLIDGDALVSTREEKRWNFLTYIAMLRLQSLTPPPIRSLPEEVQADINMLWPSYKASIQAGTDFFYELGKPGAIQQQCKQSLVGKKLPDSVYVHRTAEGQMSKDRCPAIGARPMKCLACSQRTHAPQKRIPLAVE
jgi:hypothetical protein